MRNQRSGSSGGSTVHYPATQPRRGAQNTVASIFSDRGTAPSTIRAQPIAKLGVADRGQALVGTGRLGPTRPHDGRNAPMGGDGHYKSSFKTPGAGSREMAHVDFAHCKNMKGRFEDLSSATAPSGAGHCSYGAARNCQVGQVRPLSARGMPSFSSMCNKEQPRPPTTGSRDIDIGLEAREYRLTNMLARAGI
eukprot:CAMPEP_0173392060 /NCGR_PEP_ID=MMETSP1356-20130122/18739_1 /TAXON_ID=77927 ORGANISM="Hemiselmis virescens, Strain PCC157" /NCGR_SAMPLE_ID=MMETSP1356 /ASSEMBLY_ACC=CAM_ASM_000847 /LENGTH=192 /DNA_ID=CAMNT_0014349773 /DNA_START=31 /DNA_END=609 /DNA_ORIENTATION=+